MVIGKEGREDNAERVMSRSKTGVPNSEEEKHKQRV